ncbi:hypothetical protein JOD41_001605 [Peptoniphilus gorbachii]|uniref:Uncharacterized protein n=1 Tax=Peptoniphilus gorbachii TaxID=411567 RepID=A0ABS2MLG2_9FIRM|nr:hypothetical protein [Peptoniphilus gorbachii]
MSSPGLPSATFMSSTSTTWATSLAVSEKKTSSAL